MESVQGLCLVEHVDLYEVVVGGGVDGLIIINESLLENLVAFELVLILSGVLRENVEDVLFSHDGFVGSSCWDPPLVGVLLWVVLCGEERVIFGLEC